MWVDITSNENNSEQEQQFKITSTLLTTPTKNFVFDKQQHTDRPQKLTLSGMNTVGATLASNVFKM
jgi:hypothetical protein